ncbi:very-long-chain (3R)-3-hydroxyacyl-CoA dehydratase like protein [Verticillium longisporum]|nr:very-long-chain (3R)-3-hydroxyacyl-CoA dehydratase like protein [Verticillium longisporum]
MHTVVHLPTFRHEFEACALAGTCNRSWAALYYAILAHTLYHVEGSSLLADELQSYAGVDLTRTLLDKSVDLLFQGNFMSDHRITSIQAICLLLQVAHNFDKSDMVCILVSTAIRISQCLNLHVLGQDAPTTATTNGTGRKRSDQELVEREIQKRIWWFLVRYDWLQIPFQNICQIHPTQFTTPMPLNCFDELERMIRDGMVDAQSDHVPTSTRWTVTMDQVSVLIWKHQDRINAGNAQGEGSQTLEALYEHVIWADREIKHLYATWPLFMREVDASTVQAGTNECLPTVPMPGLLLLCTAHEILSVHRHFQLLSFRDRRFAFTQMSCLAIVERALTAIQAWPDTTETRIARRMWTTLTQVVSCSVNLVFALVFKNENPLMYDVSEFRNLLSFTKDFLQREEHASSIAARGVKLIGALADLERWPEGPKDIEEEMGRLSEPNRHAMASKASESRKPQASPLKNGYLILYNAVSASIWASILFRTVAVYSRHGPAAVPLAVASWTLWAQSAAGMEVIHSLLGVVRAPVLTTFVQVAGRCTVLWAYIRPFPQVAQDPAYTAMVVAWSMAEVIRYSYFVFHLSDMLPRALVWLRYSMFFVLYPVGILGEIRLVLLATEFWWLYSQVVPYITYAALTLYVPASYILFSHLMKQRRKVLGNPKA